MGVRVYGSVYVARIGTALPVGSEDAGDAVFVDLGTVKEDGVTVTPSESFGKVGAWQSAKAVRTVKTEDELSVSFSLMQWNEETVPLALGGGTISATTGPETKYVPPAAGTVDERIFVVEWIDDTNDYRLVIPRGMVIDVSDIELTKSQAAELALTVEVLGSTPDDFIIFTNDPAWD